MKRVIGVILVEHKQKQNIKVNLLVLQSVHYYARSDQESSAWGNVLTHD